MPLKTAYELATERIIEPKFPKGKRTLEEGASAIPEFVNDWEHPDGKLEEEEINKAFVSCGVGDQDIIEFEAMREVEEMRNKMGHKVEMHKMNIEEDLMEVHWNGHFLDYGGFARMNRTFAFGLSARNVKVKIEIEPNQVHVNDATKNELEAMTRTKIAPDATKVYGVTVPLMMTNPGKRIVYTMVESSEKVHKDYVGKLDLATEVWVPTEYGKEILKQSGATVPIKVMPLGVDPLRYRSGIKPMNIWGKGLRGFRFLSVFRWSYRKGYDILIRSFLEEFSAEDDVSLIMVCRPIDMSEEEGTKKIAQDFNDIKNSVNKEEHELPHVALYTKPIRELNMPKVYNTAHAFALISRGEGFGLPYLEAASCGLPVIGSNCSGQSDFLKEDNSYLVEPDRYIKASTNGNMSKMAKLCHFYQDQIFPDFGGKAIAQTRDQMRNVFENYGEAKEKNEKLRSLIQSKYTWEQAIDRVYNRLREIKDN